MTSPAYATETADGSGAHPAEVLAALEQTVPTVADSSTSLSGSDADSVMVAEGAGARVDVPRDSSEPVVITPVNETSVPLHASTRDVAVADAPAAAEQLPDGMPAVEPVATPAEEDLEAAVPEATDPVEPPPLEQRTIEVTVPGASEAQAGVQAEPGLAVFEGSDDSTSQAVQSSADGATRFLTIIDGPDAPQEFRFELGLAPGVTLSPQDDGSIVLLAPESDDLRRLPIARIAAPWAVDANKRDLGAQFSIDGHAITLHVDHEGAAYPVTADPELFFFHYFSPLSPSAVGGSMWDNSVGLFTTQIGYRDMSRLSMQWGFKLSHAQQRACSYHRVSQFARASVNGRMTRYNDDHSNEACNYQFHSSMSKYTYADDRWFPKTHYLRGYIGMKLSLWVSLQFPTGPRSVRQIHIYADYVI